MTHPTDFRKPTKVSELCVGDVVRLVGGEWENEHPCLNLEGRVTDTSNGWGTVDTGSKWGSCYIDDAGWTWEFVSHPGGLVEMVILHEEPIVLIGGVASSAAIREASERAKSAVKRKCREWPYGKTLDGEVRGDKLCVFWVDE